MLDTATDLGSFDLFNPTEEHKMLRDMVQEFVREEVEPQAEEYKLAGGLKDNPTA